MATEQFVLRTLRLRLDQCDVLLEWLIHKNPGKESLIRALESLHQTQSIVTDSLVESN